MPFKVVVEYEGQIREKTYLTKGKAMNAELMILTWASVTGRKVLSSHIEEI